MTPAPQTESLIAQLEALIDKVTPLRSTWRFSPWHIEEGPSAVRCDGYGIVASTPSDNLAEFIALCSPANLRTLLDSYRTAERERDEARAENTRLRAALAQSDQPCAYCSLPAEDWNKCAAGFPGCDRADDAMGCPELGAGMRAESAESALSARSREVERLTRERDQAQVSAVRIAIEREAARQAMSFFASAVKSGEKWTDECQRVFNAAKAMEPS